MPAAKGTRPPAAGKGRPKGARNKRTRDIREMIRASLDKAGGVSYLRRRPCARYAPAPARDDLGRRQCLTRG